DPGIFHSSSFAKYAVAFFKITFSISRRATWARNRDSSICSAVICLAPAGFSLPAFAALTQLRSVCSISPSSSAARAMLPTSSARLTACSLNSAVYSCFGMRFTSFFLSLRRSYDDYVGRRNSWGSSGRFAQARYGEAPRHSRLSQSARHRRLKMAQVINTNVYSLNAQRNLNKNSLGLSTALERLSSGLRVNSAKDDAAGL